MAKLSGISCFVFVLKSYLVQYLLNRLDYCFQILTTKFSSSARCHQFLLIILNCSSLATCDQGFQQTWSCFPDLLYCDNIIETYLCSHHFIDVNSNFNFTFLSTSNVYLLNFCLALQFHLQDILHILLVCLQDNLQKY